MNSPVNFVCIEGNIGSGKTSLAKRLAQHFNAPFVGEEFEENPFLPLFYKEPGKFAFALEFSFLLDRARQLSAMRNKLKSKLHFSDYYIEKCLYFAQNNLNAEQFVEFSKAFPAVSSLVPHPDLLVFLHLSEENLLKNINKRGRLAEKEIDRDYLQRINSVYLENSRKQRLFNVINFHISNPGEAAYQKVFEELLKYIRKPADKNISLHF